MGDFGKQWGDKLLLVFLCLIFVGVAIHGWHVKNGDQASFASDLAKQLISALLTLLVATKPWQKGDTNVTTQATPASSSTTVSTTS